MSANKQSKLQTWTDTGFVRKEIVSATGTRYRKIQHINNDGEHDVKYRKYDPDSGYGEVNAKPSAWAGAHGGHEVTVDGGLEVQEAVADHLGVSSLENLEGQGSSTDTAGAVSETSGINYGGGGGGPLLQGIRNVTRHIKENVDEISNDYVAEGVARAYVEQRKALEAKFNETKPLKKNYDTDTAEGMKKYKDDLDDWRTDKREALNQLQEDFRVEEIS